jgi:hypothetical protein
VGAAAPGGASGAVGPVVSFNPGRRSAGMSAAWRAASEVNSASLAAGSVSLSPVTTRTSSRRFRSAAGFSTIDVYGWCCGSGAIETMVPTGSPRGNTWSPPEVSTVSPGLMRLSAVRLSISMRPCREPRTMARMRVDWRMTPAPESGSLSNCSSDVPGKTSRSLPTTPSGVMTAISGFSPASDPLFSVRIWPWSEPDVPITCAATVRAM